MSRIVFSMLTSIALLCAPGCSEKPSTDHSHAHELEAGETDGHAHEAEHAHEESSGADFDQGQGLALSPQAAETIGLQTAQAAQRTLALEFPATARVFHTAHEHGSEFPGHKDGHAYANAMIPGATADLLRAGQTVELERPAGGGAANLKGQVKSLDRETTRAIGQVEALIEIPDPQQLLDFGAFLTARFAGTERNALVIPRSSHVNAATGDFVYVQNGERWLRRAVKIGGANEDYVEILEGLSEGETVVGKGAVDLWLIELRFTKGGGHSH